MPNSTPPVAPFAGGRGTDGACEPFVKRGPAGRLAQEGARTTAARRLADESGLFRVPTVYPWRKPDELALELIPGITPLREVLPTLQRSAERKRLVAQIGTIIATVHSALEPPLIGAASGGGRFTTVDPVPVHGDFGVTNTQVSPEGSVVLLDWIPPAWAPAIGTIASSHWDLAMFLVDLNYQRVGEPRKVPDTRGLSAAFLDGYERVRGISRPQLRRSTAAMTIRYYMGAARGMRSMLRIPSSTALLR